MGEKGEPGATGGAGNAGVATFEAQNTVSVGEECLKEVQLVGPGRGKCPEPTTGYSAEPTLAGPMPADGATVTTLYADSNATVTGTDTVTVAVIDNTTGAELLSCIVNSTNINHCENGIGSGSAAAGDNIEVKLTIHGTSGNGKSWRVRFRY
jgi:hypothetical protein